MEKLPIYKDENGKIASFSSGPISKNIEKDPINYTFNSELEPLIDRQEV